MESEYFECRLDINTGRVVSQKPNLEKLLAFYGKYTDVFLIFFKLLSKNDDVSSEFNVTIR